MTACIFLVALGWKVLPCVRTVWVKREERSGASLVVTALDPQAQRRERLWHMQGVLVASWRGHERRSRSR